MSASLPTVAAPHNKAMMRPSGAHPHVRRLQASVRHSRIGIMKHERCARRGRYPRLVVRSGAADGGEVHPPGRSCQCRVIHGDVSPGQRIDFPGTVVVVGDVQDGASVRATEDIIIIGGLHGAAHAGCEGEDQRIINCSQFSPDRASVRISTFTADRPALATVSCDRRTKFSMKAGVICPTHPQDTQPVAQCSSSNGARQPWLKASIFTGSYITLVGVLLLAAPQTIFGILFDITTIAKGWIRVFGVLCIAFGSYYLGAADGDLRGRTNSFYRSTVWGRLVLVGCLCGIVAIGELPATLLILALANFLGAASMWWALNKTSSSM